jgi:hypothetical protein
VLLDGTLTVDNNPSATTTTMNPDGSTTTSTPIAGRLGNIGVVRGVWNDNVDAFGDATGLDSLRLHGAKGTFVIEIDSGSQGPARNARHGDIYRVYAQRLYAGTGVYAGATESGTINVTTTALGSEVKSMTVHSRAS